MSRRGRLRKLYGIDPIALVAAGLIAKAPPPTQASYVKEAATICAGARLFDGTHSIGTRAGALAVARDIRATGRNRLNRVDALPKPTATGHRVASWLTLERRLVELYAANYVRIWNAIEHAYTTRRRVGLPAVLRSLIDEPRRLEVRAAAIEVELGLPDCTGGGQSRPPPLP